MPADWTPELLLDEHDGRCRLVLAGCTYGAGRTLQEAGDDLIARLVRLALGMRASGVHGAAELGMPDRRSLDFMWDVAERAMRGESVRARVFG